MMQAFATTLWQLIPRAVLAAVATAVCPCASAAQAPTPQRGQVIVHSSCETCHSLVPAQVKLAPSLFGLLNGPTPRSTPESVKEVIQHGRNNKMPAYGDLFTASELESIVQYLKQLQ